MAEVGLKIIKEMGHDIKKVKLGFHKPPFTSVNHLHLHVAVLPINSAKHEKKHFGNWMISHKKALEYLETYGSVYKG